MNSCALLVLAITGKDHWTMLSAVFVQSRIKINGKTVYVALLRTQNATVPHPLGEANLITEQLSSKSRDKEFLRQAW